MTRCARQLTPFALSASIFPGSLGILPPAIASSVVYPAALHGCTPENRRAVAAKAGAVGEDCLSSRLALMTRASSAAADLGEQRRVTRQGGEPGRPSLGLLSLGRARESNQPRGCPPEKRSNESLREASACCSFSKASYKEHCFSVDPPCTRRAYS